MMNWKKKEMKNKNKLYIRCYIIKKIKNINKKLEKLKKIVDTMWYRFKKIKKSKIIISTMWSYFLLLTGECRQEELVKKFN